MIDPYLLFAPILLLGIVALLRFVGCNFTVNYTPTAPNALAATAGNALVALAWQESDSDTTGYSYQVYRSDDSESPPAAPILLVTVPNTSYTDKPLKNDGTTYTYTVTASSQGEASKTSNPASAAPALLSGRPPKSVLDPANPLSTNLIGLFIMNEGKRTDQNQPAQDTNLVDGTTANAAGTAPPSWEVADPSVRFNGGTSLNSYLSYLDAAADLSFNDMTVNKITIVAKVLAFALTTGGICEKNDGKPPNSDSGFVFALDNNGALRLTVEFSTHSMRIQTADGIVSEGQWIQLAFTWDGTQYIAATQTGPATAAAIYVNSVQQANATAADGNGTLDTSHASNNFPFRIGNASYDFTGSFYGKVAYLAVYKGTILTTAQLAMLDAALPIKAG